MPRNVRNFWIEARIDGRRSVVSTGPRRKDGGFDLTVKMRREGTIIDAVTLVGCADDQGRLTLKMQGANGDMLIETRR